MTLTNENLLENVFALSTDIANFFGIRHNNLIRNIRKLQKEKQLPELLLNFEQPFKAGNTTELTHITYALTRPQTYHLIMNLSGKKARGKKHSIITRLEAIETNVLRCDYAQARQIASSWDGVQLLTDLGFTPSLHDQMATKDDIATFLNIPISSLTTFLARHSDQIKTTKLTKEQIRASGRISNRLNAYSQDDVFKIAFWMDTEVGSKLKKKIFGDIGVYSTPETKEEVEWKIIISKIFAGLGFKYQHLIGDYVVDFFVEKLALVLECDKDNHRYYDPAEEKKRDKFITRHYSLIRFNSQISLEALVNAILQVQPKEMVKLYLPLETKKSPTKA